LKKALLFIGLFAFFVISAAFVLPKDDEEEYTMIYVANEALAPGDRINEEQLRLEPINEVQDWMVTDFAELQGLYVGSVGIEVNRYIDKSLLDSKAPIIYEEGEGEYTIKTQTEYVNGGKIRVGDKVNVIATPLRSQNELIGKGTTVATDVTVISIRTRQGEDMEMVKEETNKNEAPYAVTLKTDFETAKELAWGQENGTLSLFLLNK